MAWKETTRVFERYRFIEATSEGNVSFAELCRRFSISRQTGYKWWKRFDAEAPFESLKDKPRLSIRLPHHTPYELEDALVALRKRRPTWGPKKLRAALRLKQPDAKWPAISTIGELLKRKGLVNRRRRRVHTQWNGIDVEGAKQPNDVWAVDFKGHFALRNRERCHPLTVTDLFSRYLLVCEGLPTEKWEPVKERLELAFREFGLPRRLRSDNGGPFSSLARGGLCPLAVWLVRIGVTPERIRPRSPQENGSHERMHKTLKAEATRPPQADFASQQRAFDDFRADFNRQRPHEALGQQTPQTLYSTSSRCFPESLREPEYPSGFEVRRTSGYGCFTLKQTRIFLSKALLYGVVGLKPVDNDIWQLFYGELPLGFVDARQKPYHRESLPEPKGAGASADAPAPATTKAA